VASCRSNSSKPESSGNSLEFARRGARHA
jgi:hypothetical protein